MSLVTTTRSQVSRIVLQSISTSVVLPEPTGPPTPTRSGGSGRVRRGMSCRALMSCSLMMKKDGRRRSRPEQPGILFLVLCGEDGEHRREGLHLGARQPQRGVDGARNLER